MPESIAAFQAARDAGHDSAVALVERALAAIDRDAHLCAWCAIAPRDALLEAARQSDARHASGQLIGPLDGVTVGVKDNVSVAGLPMTAASKMLAGFMPPHDAEVVRRLRAAGAIVLGMQNMDEFGMGSSSERSVFGAVQNPAAPGHIAGGSSGGSAVAVAARHCLLAIGSDTGGSVRQPASHCGVVGFKPSYGRISRRGLLAYASSLDHVGLLARSVADVALAMDVVAGHDPWDSTSLVASPDAMAPDATLRVGVPTGLLQEAALDPSVRAALEDALARLGAASEVCGVDLPHLPLAVSAYYVLAAAEASSNLARYDGVRFGHRAAGAATLPELYARSRAEGFGAEVKRRVLLGTFVLSVGDKDAYHRRAQQARALIGAMFAAAFETVDLIVMPVAPRPAPKLGALGAALAREGFLEDMYTTPASLAGLPAISVPGLPAPDGRPIGVQLIAAPRAERALLAFAQRVLEVRP